MKSLKKYIIGLATLTMGLGFTACQDDFDDNTPGLNVPVATWEANSTILEVKQAYWQNTVNYIDTITAKEDGTHYIVKGRVISSDRTGNVYKKLVIQDETAALALSINTTGMYTKYAPGQEIVLDLTGMYIGKYNGTQQLGYPMFYEKGQVWEATFMPPVLFESHMQLNGLPEVAAIDTISLRNFSELPSDPTLLPGMQSQLVRFNNVSFVEGGKKAMTDGYKETTNRLITDSEGQTLTVRTSGYATFRDVMLPEGNGDVVGILDYYATSDDSDSNPWQLTLLDANGVMNFGNPTIEPGGEDNPYTVEQAIAIEEAGEKAKGWTTGYIVGAVAPEVTEVTSNDDIEWGADVVLANTLVIGPTADCTDFNKCLVISLPQDSKLREVGNLRDNPNNFGKQIWLYGTLAKYMGTWGITDNTGASSQFRIEGIDAGGAIADGNGTEGTPYNVGQVIAMNPSSTTEAVESKIWVAGYIVGYMPSEPSTLLSNAVFAATADLQTNIVLGPTPDCTDYSKCIGIQLPSGAVRTALNLQTNPGMYGAKVALLGDVMKYCGGPGLKNTSKYTLLSEGSGDTGGDTPGGDTPVGDGDGSYEKPFAPADVIALNPQFTTEAAAGGAGVWVKGFIVGHMPSTNTLLENAVFGVSADIKTNIVLAPTAGCKDYTQCISVQLPSGAVRNALNLYTNPDMLGAEVLLYGDVMKYCGAPGLKNTSKYEIVGEGGGNTGGDTPGGGTGDGTLESPYDVVRALAIIEAGSMTSDNVYIKGKISEISEIDTSYGNATYYISNDGTTSEQLQVYRGYYLNGAKFTSTDALKVGDEVVILGKLIKYNTTPEVAQGSSIISLNGEGGGNTGGDEPSTGGNTIYEGLISHCDDWTFENVNLPEAATYIWSWKEYNGSYYLNASAYVGGAAYASEAYAYTTVDLTGRSSASLTFDHAAKFQTSLQELCAVVVRVQGTTAWTALNMPTWPEAGIWTFVNCGSISLNAYAGKKIEIGFRYGSIDGGADTWEIKNFIVTGN